jgi:hypothetical protein
MAIRRLRSRFIFAEIEAYSVRGSRTIRARMRQGGLAFTVWAAVGSRRVVQVAVPVGQEILCFLRAGGSFFNLMIWDVVIFGHLVSRALRMLDCMNKRHRLEADVDLDSMCQASP